MPREPVIDGADRRKVRIREMLAMISASKGATTTQIQSFMLAKYGLRFKTTSEYIKECHIAGLLTNNPPNWITTRKYTRSAKHLYG